MDPGEMRLPLEAAGDFVTNYYLRKEWVMDPPYLRRLPDDIFRKIVQVHLEGQAKRAELEAQLKQLDAKMFARIAEVLR